MRPASSPASTSWRCCSTTRRRSPTARHSPTRPTTCDASTGCSWSASARVRHNRRMVPDNDHATQNKPGGKPSDAELRARLTPEQYHVTQEKGTERAFTGRYAHHKDKGVYTCVVCGAELFSSKEKYDSGSGWPSFWLPLAGDRVRTHTDRSHGMVRTEVVCA